MNSEFSQLKKFVETLESRGTISDVSMNVLLLELVTQRLLKAKGTLETIRIFSEIIRHLTLLGPIIENGGEGFSVN